ncbi:hypothetical protein [Sphingomonas sp. GC_Shp_4]|uniref:hypothetical protein n=2 Tax=Sphingomonas TaxID=13687 RepID=UPI00226B9AD4|nr:hypothetical protein [Sphingomonas sp. GC_Shp_4]
MQKNTATRMTDLRLTLTEAMIEADASDPLVALHLAAAIGALNRSIEDGASPARHGSDKPLKAIAA